MLQAGNILGSWERGSFHRADKSRKLHTEMHRCFEPSPMVIWTSKNRRPSDQGFLIYALLRGKHYGYLNGLPDSQPPTFS